MACTCYMHMISRGTGISFMFSLPRGDHHVTPPYSQVCRKIMDDKMAVVSMLYLKRFSPHMKEDPILKVYCSLLEKAPQKTLPVSSIIQSLVSEARERGRGHQNVDTFGTRCPDSWSLYLRVLQQAN